MLILLTRMISVGLNFAAPELNFSSLWRETGREAQCEASVVRRHRGIMVGTGPGPQGGQGVTSHIVSAAITFELELNDVK